MRGRLPFAVLAGLAVAGVAPEAAAQLQMPVYPPWTGLVVAELAQKVPEPSAELKACFEAQRAALLKKPEAVSPLIADHLGADPMRRDCAMAAEADAMARQWRRSSSINSYGPLITFISNQNKSLSKKSDMEKCQGRQFIFDSAKAFNGIVMGTVPKHVYDWVEPVAGAPCRVAQE